MSDPCLTRLCFCWGLAVCRAACVSAGGWPPVGPSRRGSLEASCLLFISAVIRLGYDRLVLRLGAELLYRSRVGGEFTFETIWGSLERGGMWEME